ncbi:MAG: hypothetical protein ABI897_11585 [Spartobacteria bacterium]
MFGAQKYFVLLTIALSLALPAAAPAGKTRSTSTSRQFLVYGADVQVRGAMCDLAERTKTNLLRLLDQRDNWKTPLIVNLDYPRSNLPDVPTAQLIVSQTGFGLKMQLNLLVTADLQSRNVQQELLRAILVEMIYRERGNIPAGTAYVTPPDWLVDGIIGLQPARANDGDAQLLQSIIAAKKIAPLEQIVRQQRAQLDAPSRRFFEAYARALLQLLLDSPGGKQKLVQFLADLPAAPNDPLADLSAHFPETLGRSLGKWWALSVAQLSATHRYETLSAAETSARLDRALRFTLPAPDGRNQEFSLGDYAKFRRLRGAREGLRQVSRQLLLLSARAHPSYRPLVQEDFELADLLARGKAGKLAGRFEQVASYRAVVERQAGEIDDFLNWYEGTQAKTMSGTFSQVIDPARAAGETVPRRRDPISVYLDSIEMETN